MAPSQLTIHDTVLVRSPNGDIDMPRLGFGVGLIPKSECTRGHEEEVGDAIRQSGLARSDIWVTAKLGHSLGHPQDDYKNALESVHNIAGEDGYVDLFLVHDPSGDMHARRSLWRALERLLRAGKTRSIGVSNYDVGKISEMRDYSRIWPPHVNQVELNPWDQKKNLVEYCKSVEITLVANSPLRQGNMSARRVTHVARKYSRSLAQVLIRYSLQKG